MYPQDLPLVSVIVPVYNAGDRLRKGIHSLRNQTLKDLEIILINDGSSDDSLEIMIDEQNKDERIIVIDGSNEGAAVARNKGLSIAHGNFIGFMDADDWVEKEMFQKLLKTIEEDKTDLAICNVKKEYENIGRDCLLINKHAIEQKGLLHKLLQFDFDYSVCNKLYKREHLLKSNLNFEPSLRIGQDLLFNLYVFTYIKSLSVIPDPFYHYVAKEGSLMSSSPQKRIYSFNHIIKCFEKFCKERQKINEWEVFKNRIGSAYQSYFFNLILRNPTTEKLNFKNYYSYLFAHLKLLDPLLLAVPLNNLSRYQRFKKSLLQKGRFRLFSFFAAVRHKTILR